MALIPPGGEVAALGEIFKIIHRYIFGNVYLEYIAGQIVKRFVWTQPLSLDERNIWIFFYAGRQWPNLCRVMAFSILSHRENIVAFKL